MRRWPLGMAALLSLLLIGTSSALTTETATGGAVFDGTTRLQPGSGNTSPLLTPQDLVSALGRVVPITSVLKAPALTNVWNNLGRYPLRVLKETFQNNEHGLNTIVETILELTTRIPDSVHLPERATVRSVRPHEERFEAEVYGETKGEKSAWMQLTDVITEMGNIRKSEDYWLMVKPNIQRVLSYLEEEYSLSQIQKTVPFAILEQLLQFGDQMYLLKFLREKLDEDFAEYIVNALSQHIKPLEDLGHLYQRVAQGDAENIIKDYSINAINHVFHEYGPIISEGISSVQSMDGLTDFLEMVIPSNSSLSPLKGLASAGLRELGDSGRIHRRVARQALLSTDGARRRDRDNVRRGYGYDHNDSYDRDGYGHDDGYGRDDGYGHDDGYEHEKGYGHEKGYEHDDKGYEHDDKGHGHSSGGYGGGGYGSGYGGGHGGSYGQATLDPYVVLGALALGTLLAFVLYRIINGTGAAGRDVPDHSFLLWLSDSPDIESEPRGNVSSRSIREVDPNMASQWNNKGFISGLNIIEQQLSEAQYPLDHLNGLWRQYKATEDEGHLRRRLCEYLETVATVDQFAGAKSVNSLLMASAGVLLGVPSAGQLLDHVALHRTLAGAGGTSCLAH